MSDFYEPVIETVEDILRLPAQGRALCWQIDSLARKLLGHLSAPNLAALMEIGCWVEDDWVVWYRPGRSLSAMRLLGGRISVEGTRRYVTSPAGLFGGKRLLDILTEDHSSLETTMSKLRHDWERARLPLPNQWCGPGDLASAAMRHWKIEPIKDPPPATLNMKQVYYGGRIEITAHGDVEGPLYEYDLNSAYGAAMVELPPEGGTWHEGAAGDSTITQCRWRMPQHLQGRLGPLPVRRPDGVIHYPQSGRGIYWEHELAAAERFGAEIRREKSWYYLPPVGIWPPMFEMVDHLYAARATIGSVAKPVLPACYGKFIQHRGTAKWHSLTAASYITATVRAWILDAAGLAPDDIMMIATDSVWSRVPLALCGGKLPGEWKVAKHDWLHVVSPGLYWTRDGKLKTAGWRASDVEPKRAELERLWRHREIGGKPPEIYVQVEVNGTIPLAVLFQDHKMLDSRTTIEMRLSYGWQSKRARELDRDSLGAWRSWPKRASTVNAAYSPEKGPDLTKMMEVEL